MPRFTVRRRKSRSSRSKTVCRADDVRREGLEDMEVAEFSEEVVT